MIKSNLLIFMVISVLIVSTISGATIVSASLNQSNSSKESLTNISDLEYSNKTKDVSSNCQNKSQYNNLTKKQKKLISNLNQTVFDLNVLCEASNDAVLSEFSDQNIQKLKSEVNNSTMDYKTKQKLLKKINAISKVNKQALKLIESGQKKKADRKINLEYEKLYQFQKYVEKKKGTSIENSTADDLLNITNTMIQGHSNGAKWILDNNQNMTFNQTNDYYDNIKSKVSEIKGIIKELKAQGVPISVETVDVESLNSSNNNNNNNNNNKTSK